MKVIVGSQNPVKIEAVKEAFSKFFDNVEAIGIAVSSNVPDQPKNDETHEGARNRALALKQINQDQNLNADYFVGIEGGISKLVSKWFCAAVICVIDNKGREGFGSTTQFELPDKVTKQIFQGVELGKAMDKLRGFKDTKLRDGSVGYFTKGIMDREKYYVNGLINALIPFINSEIYFDEK